ncbi:hypothetical protein Bhyg_01556 [Pseudolycoriella hygida]|uniref:Uncharacterized protein n=1 Tax=Pseudolycoriella hygida TaxID=35572 RepID=A0A9Q0S7P3_9DIPT|nr:hypothetical protein Bhyg_01556 [Pseudolycoriella hygida]
MALESVAPQICMTTCFGGLPDVTEHANRHPLSLREPSTNSESLDISSNQKAPLPSRSSSPTTPTAQQKDVEKRKLNRKCGFCTCLTIFFLTSCALIGILVVHLILNEDSGDRESQEQRMKIVRRLLQETPLIVLTKIAELVGKEEVLGVKSIA